MFPGYGFLGQAMRVMKVDRPFTWFMSSWFLTYLKTMSQGNHGLVGEKITLKIAHAPQAAALECNARHVHEDKVGMVQD